MFRRFIQRGAEKTGAGSEGLFDSGRAGARRLLDGLDRSKSVHSGWTLHDDSTVNRSDSIFGKMMERKISPAAQEWCVDEAGAGQRLDNYLLRHLKGVPKSHVYRIIRSGEVRVDGRRAQAQTRLAQGQRVRVPPVRVAEAPVRPAIPAGPSLPVIHEDEDLLVLDKPAGLAVHGGSGVAFGVIERLRAERPGASLLELVHRLDRETSGLLMVAKRRSTLKALQDALRAGQVRKRYLALVHGLVEHPVQHVRAPLFKYLTPEGERRVRVSPEGKVAHSIVRRLRRWPQAGYTLVEVELKTGRTHQIRVHMAHLGHPLVGDEKYGRFAANKALARAGFDRMFLHAAFLSFVHPRSGLRLELEAPLPPELGEFLAGLGPGEEG